MQKQVDALLNGPIIAVNIGPSMFGESLKEQRVEVVQVDWIPPAGGDKEMTDLLDRLL
jgi:hypothetical protein